MNIFGIEKHISSLKKKICIEKSKGRNINYKKICLFEGKIKNYQRKLEKLREKKKRKEKK